MLEFGCLESCVDVSRLYLSFSVNSACSVVLQTNDDLLKIVSWCCYNLDQLKQEHVDAAVHITSIVLWQTK